MSFMIAAETTAILDPLDVMARGGSCRLETS